MPGPVLCVLTQFSQLPCKGCLSNEAQRGKVICLGLQSEEIVKLGYIQAFLNLRAHVLSLTHEAGERDQRRPWNYLPKANSHLITPLNYPLPAAPPHPTPTPCTQPCEIIPIMQSGRSENRRACQMSVLGPGFEPVLIPKARA